MNEKVTKKDLSKISLKLAREIRRGKAQSMARIAAKTSLLNFADRNPTISGAAEIIKLLKEDCHKSRV